MQTLVSMDPVMHPPPSLQAALHNLVEDVPIDPAHAQHLPLLVKRRAVVVQRSSDLLRIFRVLKHTTEEISALVLLTSRSGTVSLPAFKQHKAYGSARVACSGESAGLAARACGLHAQSTLFQGDHASPWASWFTVCLTATADCVDDGGCDLRERGVCRQAAGQPRNFEFAGRP